MSFDCRPQWRRVYQKENSKGKYSILRSQYMRDGGHEKLKTRNFIENNEELNRSTELQQPFSNQDFQEKNQNTDNTPKNSFNNTENLKDNKLDDFSDEEDLTSDSTESSEEAEILKELEQISKEHNNMNINRDKKLDGYNLQIVENPLLTTNRDNNGTTMENVKKRRRWDADVLFKNKATNKETTTTRFINDTLRNDFHKKFLKRHFI